MPFTISRPTEADLEKLLAMNEANVPHVNSISMDEMKHFDKISQQHFLVVREDAQIAGFVIALTPGLEYGSMNYKWFNDRYSTRNFLYIDRIMVSPEFRRRGVATLMYRHLYQLAATQNLERLTCEVNVQPPNPESMAMHVRLGFAEVGRQETEGGKKQVALLAWPISPD